ncbi:peptidase family M49 [Phycomyces nitens]|nr:peptidase family M49 [Phycomyces nitens]
MNTLLRFSSSSLRYIRTPLIRNMSTRYLADLKTPISRLEARPFFEALTDKEKTYAHFMSRASFHGTRIVIAQTNPQAPGIYDLILQLFTNEREELIDVDALAKKSGVSQEAFDQLLEYSAQFLGNLSNYKSFGDEKFIPRLSADDFEKIVEATESHEAHVLFTQKRGEIYNVEPVAKNLIGYPDDGHISGYYSKNITKEDIRIVQEYLEKIDISPLNTRLFKTAEGYQLHIASSQAPDDIPQPTTLENGITLEIFYNDFQSCMTKAADMVKGAIRFAANDHQKKMLEAYYESFNMGSIEAHMESQREWLKDINPRVETNLGFIETYRDPQGVRAEWEGFVAMVNEEQTKKFNNLVDQAPLFVSRLPWPPAFEREAINKPDFTSLEVLSFATAGVPAGINIPNYTNITQVLGSKNVSLGNVISAQSPGEKYPFIRQQDLDLYTAYRNTSFEVQVGTHEMGHGTGKLLEEDAQGNLNFDRGTIDPLTNQPVKSWYKPGQTFNSVFKSIASSYEECRAECIAMVLGPHKDILKIFNLEGEKAEDVLYIMYLNMARAGLTALEFYDPTAKKWGQAHMQARYAILNTMLKSGQGFVEIKPTTIDGQDTLEIHLDRSKIRSVGAPAVAVFLNKLQVYKAMAAEQLGTQFYLDATSVPEDWATNMRDIVLRNKQPRKVFVQANTFIENGKVVLKDYEPTAVGMIQSYVERRV